MKWSPTRPAVTHRHVRHLGIGAIRVTLRWAPGQTNPRGTTMVALRRAERAAVGRKLVLAVYSAPNRAPLDRAAHARAVLHASSPTCSPLAPQVNDVVIWNEPNSPAFWQPQFAPTAESAAPPRTSGCSPTAGTSSTQSGRT